MRSAPRGCATSPPDGIDTELSASAAAGLKLPALRDPETERGSEEDKSEALAFSVECRRPDSMGGSYVNFMGQGEDQERVQATYRDHYDRPAQVKRTYDPDNLLGARRWPAGIARTRPCHRRRPWSARRGGRAPGRRLLDDTGFDPYDAGTLADSWRQQPNSPAYCTELTLDELPAALAAADRVKDTRIRDSVPERFAALPATATLEDVVEMNRAAHR